MHTINNLADASGYLLNLALRDRSSLSRMMKSAGTSVLDSRFENESPIPHLPVSILNKITAFDVTLPPLSAIEPANQGLTGLAVLASLCKFANAKTIFEIGTYNGLSASTLAKNVPGATIVTLDLPSAQTPQLPLSTGDELYIRDHENRYFELETIRDQVLPLEGDSATFDFSPYFGRCNIVYVDGAHSYEYVISDTANAKRLLTERSAIVWDDYTRDMVGVRRGLDEISRGLEIYRIPRTRLVVYFTPSMMELVERA